MLEICRFSVVFPHSSPLNSLLYMVTSGSRKKVTKALPPFSLVATKIFPIFFSSLKKVLFLSGRAFAASLNKMVSHSGFRADGICSSYFEDLMQFCPLEGQMCNQMCPVFAINCDKYTSHWFANRLKNHPIKSPRRQSTPLLSSQPALVSKSKQDNADIEYSVHIMAQTLKKKL